MSNMDAFTEAAAVILDKLYQAFPLRIPLRDDSFGDLSDEQRPIYRDTIHFLASEGIIRYHSPSREAYRALAKSPVQDARYRELVAILEGVPEWHDGAVVSALP